MLSIGGSGGMPPRILDTLRAQFWYILRGEVENVDLRTDETIIIVDVGRIVAARIMCVLCND